MRLNLGSIHLSCASPVARFVEENEMRFGLGRSFVPSKCTVDSNPGSRFLISDDYNGCSKCLLLRNWTICLATLDQTGSFCFRGRLNRCLPLRAG
jgi:hypothetical protein